MSGRTLTNFLRAYSLQTIWPPPDFTIDLVARARSISREEALKIVEANQRIRCIIEGYVGREIGDDASIRQLFGKLSIDFGLSTAEADMLTPIHLGSLLTNIQRLEGATDDFEQDILHQIASNRGREERNPTDPASTPIYLKALRRFPEPKPDTMAEEATGATCPGPAPSQDLSPGNKAMAAALELKQLGKPVSLLAACKLAQVDRKNIERRHPDTVKAIKALATPDRDLRRGIIDRRSGCLDAVDEGDK